MESREGREVPDVEVNHGRNGAWQPLRSGLVFSGKRIVAFGLPGAFTPTCSSAHVPRFEELAPAFAQQGIDELLCIAVNDPYVLEAWRRSEGVSRLSFLADGNGDFTRKLGMLVDKRAEGLGERSWRYAMVVRDGVIEKMFVEAERSGDPYQVSSADNVLHWLDPGGRRPPDIFMLGREGCSYCERARALLEERQLEFEEVAANPRRLKAVSGRETTPQIFVDGEYVGGCDDLEAYLEGHALEFPRRGESRGRGPSGSWWCHRFFE
ncbi:MAG: glutathione peroxidase [Myxococcales bacterium]|nr:glutathione peroxidase [Myxococcales bacterium]